MDKQSSAKDPGEHDVDPEAILRAIDAEQRRALAGMSPNVGWLFAVWGIAWIAGFGVLYLSFVPATDPVLGRVVAIGIAAGAGAAAIATSVVHSVRKGSGSRGPSMVQGAILGNLHPVALGLLGLLGWRLIRAGVGATDMLSFWVAGTCLVIGVLSVVGALLADDRFTLVFGGWILVTGFVSLVLAPPHNLLAGVGGGVGFVVLAVIGAARPKLLNGPIAKTADD